MDDVTIHIDRLLVSGAVPLEEEVAAALRAAGVPGPAEVSRSLANTLEIIPDWQA